MATSPSSQRKNETGLVRSYAAALKQAGVAKDDLQLLRELADLNARELSEPMDYIPPSRLLLNVARSHSA